MAENIKINEYKWLRIAVIANFICWLIFITVSVSMIESDEGMTRAGKILLYVVHSLLMALNILFTSDLLYDLKREK